MVFILASFILMKLAEILAGNMPHPFLYRLLSQRSGRPFEGLSWNLSGILFLLLHIQNLYHENPQTHSLWHSSVWCFYNAYICKNPGLFGINWKYEIFLKTFFFFLFKEKQYEDILANPAVSGIGSGEGSDQVSLCDSRDGK